VGPTDVLLWPPFLGSSWEPILLFHQPPIKIDLSHSENIKIPFCNALSNIVFFQFASLNGESPNVLEAYSEIIFFFLISIQSPKCPM
jgi:hypothetical protein